jgi:type VI secretion system protein VasI
LLRIPHLGLLRHIARAVAFVVALPAAAGAQGSAAPPSLKQCAAMDNDHWRLQCYDTLTGRFTKPAAAPQTSAALAGDTGRWQTRRERSKLADTEDVFLLLQSDDQVSNRFGRKDYVEMVVRCMENTTSLYMSWPLFLTTGTMKLEIRFDKRPMQTMWWQSSTDYKAIGLWSGGSAIPFAKAMIAAEEMVVRLVPHGENPETVTFTVRGLNNSIEPVRKGCKW